MAGWNLALRFGLEVAALAGLATGAWRLSTGPWRWVAVIAVPLFAAVAWTTFNVPDDPSRSGAAPVEVTGSVRLSLELIILGGGAAGFLIRGPRAAGLALAALLLVHYINSIPRIKWLLHT
jgi:hypothetical protein